MNECVFTNYIENKSTVLSKQVRQKKKHLIKINHYFEDGEYSITQVIYRWSHQYVKRYDNVDIYKSDEYSWLITGFENRNTIVNGVDVHYLDISEKDSKTTRKANEQITIGGDIFLELPEVHYKIDENDKEFFRMRSISYNYLGEVHWTQQQNRPALYINSIDTTHDSHGVKFDGNSILMYVNIDKANKNLSKDIKLINGCVYENKMQYVGYFIGHWFAYTMMLYYINVSHGWRFEDITYDSIWNLGMYLLSFAKPFEGKNDWIKGVKLSYIRFLFERRAQNELAKGVKHFYRSLAQGSLIEKETKYAFPVSMNKLNKELFKERFKKPKTDHQRILENRNKRIIELRNKGYSEYTIANLLDLNRSTVHKVLANSYTL